MTASTPPTFAACLVAAAARPDFVREFDRLSGTHLARLASRSPTDALIDDATGRDRAALEQFAVFVFRAIWLPLQETADAR